MGLSGPPTSGGFSVAQAAARNGAGLGGIYKKTDSALLYNGPSLNNNTNVLVLTATVDCPSSRIKVAFGVGGKSPQVNVSGSPYNFGKNTIWNAIPQIYLPKSYSSPGARADTDPYISGRPIFWMKSQTSDDNAAPRVELFDPFVVQPGAYIAGPIANGYPPTLVPEDNLSTGIYGRYVPDAYEAMSAADRYKIYVFMWGSGQGIQIPVQVWASWEIIDPRDAEDSAALLTRCTLQPGSVKITPP